MTEVIKAAIISAIKKLVRTIVATLILVMPQIIAAFQAGAMDGDLVQKGVFGVIVAGLVAVLAFLERLAGGLAKPSA